MVIVIKDNHITQCVCENCKSVLEYALGDIKSESVGINEVKKYIVCPACGQKTETFIKPKVSVESTLVVICPKVDKGKGSYPKCMNLVEHEFCNRPGGHC